MTNLLQLLPDFDTAPFTHILHSLEKAFISTADLITLPPAQIAKRAQVPPAEVKKLVDLVVDCLGERLDQELSSNGPQSSSPISTLDDELDTLLQGGIHTRHLTEFVGESAAGKTQFLLTLLLAVQLPPPFGLAKSALYISTEAPLQTTRLSQILKQHPRLSNLSSDDAKPSLDRVQSTHLHDLEAQDHILRYQVPVAVQRHNVGLVVIDSIAANYRPEFGRSGNANRGAESFAKRSQQLAQLGHLLRQLAQNNNIAIVVANQVADRFTQQEFVPAPHSRPVSQQTIPSIPKGTFTHNTGIMLEPGQISTDDPLALDHQQRFFTGWGSDSLQGNFKTPSLGLTWTNQLSTRIAVLKDAIYANQPDMPGRERTISAWKRTVKVAFSAWCGEGTRQFEIFAEGVRSVNSSDQRPA